MDEEFFQPLVNIEFDEEEAEFNGFIRKHLICFLSGVFLYFFSFYIIRCFLIRNDNDELYTGDEDFLVYRVSVWMCSASLAVAFGANILLPFSMIGLEILHLYPDNFYTKWLNGSLLVSMWNYVFFLSNVSLFVFLPFSYFFIESQGLSFPRRPQRPFLARVYETLLVCALVIIVLIGIVDVVYSLVLQHSLISFSFFYFASLSTPLLYSFVSSLGVFVLLLSTPFGFAHMFDLFSNSLKNSGALTTSSSSRSTSNESTNKSTTTSHEEFLVLTTSVERLKAKNFERQQRRLANSGRISTTTTPSSSAQSSYHGLVSFSYQNGAAAGLSQTAVSSFVLMGADGDAATIHRRKQSPDTSATASSVLLSTLSFLPGLADFIRHPCRRLSMLWTGDRLMPRDSILLAHLRPTWIRCLLVWNLPVMMLVLIFFATLSVAMVSVNALKLLFGFRALPDYVQCVEVHQRHTFGMVGALVEIAVILYIILASFVGVYSLPIIRNIRPQLGRTSMTCVILNCGIVLLLSSALPVLARILGLTSFDLLGAYGQIDWISNFVLVISYNVIFVGCSIFSLVNKFTLPVRRELIRRFSTLWNNNRRSFSLNNNNEKNNSNGLSNVSNAANDSFDFEFVPDDASDEWHNNSQMHDAHGDVENVVPLPKTTTNSDGGLLVVANGSPPVMTTIKRKSD